MAEIVRAHRIRLPGGPFGATTPYENLIFRDTQLSPTLGTSLWESCPRLAIMGDSLIGTDYFEDFLTATIASNTIGGWTFTNATTGAITTSTTLTNGIALLTAGAVTANQGVNWQMTAPIVGLGTTKAIWFETRVQINGLSTTPQVQFFAGLSTISTALIASGVVATTDQISFNGISTTGVIGTNTTLSTTATTGTGFTWANAVWHVIGFYATPTLVSFYVDHAIVSTSSTNIPTAALAPAFVMQANGAVTPILSIDYIRVVAIR